MTLENLWFDFNSTHSSIAGQDNEVWKNKTFKKLFKVATLCNRAHYEKGRDITLNSLYLF